MINQLDISEQMRRTWQGTPSSCMRLELEWQQQRSALCLRSLRWNSHKMVDALHLALQVVPSVSGQWETIFTRMSNRWWTPWRCQMTSGSTILFSCRTTISSIKLICKDSQKSSSIQLQQTLLDNHNNLRLHWLTSQDTSMSSKTHTQAIQTNSHSEQVDKTKVWGNNN